MNSNFLRQCWISERLYLFFVILNLNQLNQWVLIIKNSWIFRLFFSKNRNREKVFRASRLKARICYDIEYENLLNSSEVLSIYLLTSWDFFQESETICQTMYAEKLFLGKAFKLQSESRLLFVLRRNIFPLESPNRDLSHRYRCCLLFMFHFIYKLPFNLLKLNKSCNLF